MIDQAGRTPSPGPNSADSGYCRTPPSTGSDNISGVRSIYKLVSGAGEYTSVTHAAESGASTPMLMALSGRTSVRLLAE